VKLLHILQHVLEMGTTSNHLWGAVDLCATVQHGRPPPFPSVPQIRTQIGDPESEVFCDLLWLQMNGGRREKQKGQEMNVCGGTKNNIAQHMS